MQETEQRRQMHHSVAIDDRAHLRCSGVTDVDSYDEHTVCAKTVCGILTIEGDGLHVKQLALETGELILDGTVRALYYTDETKTAEGGFFARLLR